MSSGPRTLATRMIEIRQTPAFSTWYDRLGSSEARSRIRLRLRRLELGNPGGVKPVGEGVSEMRIDFGPGYRVYFISRGACIVLLLCGGDKSSQAADILRAKRLAREK